MSTTYNMPWLFLSSETGCPHACTITVRHTRYYSAWIQTCPRECETLYVEIIWSKENRNI
jgi:hypothetical protein